MITPEEMSAFTERLKKRQKAGFSFFEEDWRF